MGAEIANLLPTAGPGVLIIVIGILLRLWVRAERHAEREREHAERERQRAERIQGLLDGERAKKVELLDDERKRRWQAEDAAAKVRRRKAGDLDAKD